jgi:signal transduction histidine kinase
MHAIAHARVDDQRRTASAFAAVVAAAYLITFLSEPSAFALPEGALLVAAGIIYLLGGILLEDVLEPRLGAWLATMITLALAIPLGGLIVFLSHGAAWIILLPLAAYTVALPRVWMLLALALIIAAFAIAIGWLSNWSSAFQMTIAYVTGIVFVVIFTQIAVREGKARAEVERLAAELHDANQKLREYAAQVEELATTKERNRLAREIHDGLGHYLTAINMQIEAARAVGDADRARALDALAKAQALTKEGLAEVRRSVAALRASPLDHRTLCDALARLTEECRAAGIIAEFSVVGTPRALEPQSELTLYRATEEALTNVRKHAHASRADCVIDYSSSVAVKLVVQDNGTGAQDAGGGFGLLGIRERVQLLGGSVQINAALGRGFVVEVQVPG